MKILKFGGKSLSNGEGIENTVSIIEQKVLNKESITIVVSARANATDQLELILEKAKNGKDYLAEFRAFKEYQSDPIQTIDYHAEFNLLSKLFEGIQLVGDYSLKIKDLVLAQGELLAAKVVVGLLQEKGISGHIVDSRDFFVSTDEFGNAQILQEESLKKTKAYFTRLNTSFIPITTGFIAKNQEGETTTIGRNGSNYSAALLANYLNVDEFHNYTHVNGIYSADPTLVSNAHILDEISYQEANELVSFGASILHAKTIIPLLEKNIPLRILNTFNPSGKGTLIHQKNNVKGIKSISVQSELSIINIEGKGLLGKTGIDARIFNTLNQQNISISVVSQGSSERGVGLVVKSLDVKKAIVALRLEFENDIKTRDISEISALNEVEVVTVVGENLDGFVSAYKRLIQNDIKILLINNTLSGSNISLVVKSDDTTKTVNVIHGEIFGVAKRINIAVFGKGTVGGSLIDQILKSQVQILKRKETDLNIFAIVGSQKIVLDENGITDNWKERYEKSEEKNQGIESIINFAQEHHLENLIAIDNTASTAFVNLYKPLVQGGFDLISSNKIANTVGYEYYQELRSTLKKYNKQYLYETNVGAGLPLIDTIKLLHDSGENITRIRGVFSGTLSYLFNNYSAQDKGFDEILEQAIEKGFTEPDPREDLSGNDVARKLLVLARELDLENEFDEIKIKNLIPEGLQDQDVDEFVKNLHLLNPFYEKIKLQQKKGHVLRYVGDLHGDLKQRKGFLDVDLVSVPVSSSLGQVKGSDSIFEIYTESYGDQPIIIQGAGAGAAVTARGVFGDLLRVADKK